MKGEVHTLKIMNGSGDKSVEWNTADAASIAVAEDLFNKLKKQGQVFRAQPNGEGGGQMEKFDPQADMLGVKVITGG